LALGIDTAAHRGALQAADGRTLAVLGSGLRAIHPRQNLPLAEAIAQRGALLSELHPATPPLGPNLMARDRLISGLSRAVIVVEANEKSGSLDTAAKARRQGRLLLAVPGSPGTQALLAGGVEPLDLRTTDLDALSQRIRQHTLAGNETQLGLWGNY
jgi:DNA processing protein